MDDGMRCPDCGCRGSRHGTKARQIRDIIDGQLVVRDVRVQRWLCQGCRKFFTSDPDVAKPKSSMSIAARDAIAENCFVAGYTQTASQFGLDEKTVRTAWRDWASVREQDVVKRAPSYMGIYEINIAGSPRIVITDFENLSVVDVLPNNDGSALQDWLQAQEAESVYIREVAVNFNAVYADIVREVSPHADLKICRDHSRYKASKLFALCFKSMRRIQSDGRNSRETFDIFAKRKHELTDLLHDVMDGWNDDILQLYDAKELFLQAVDQQSQQSAFELFGASKLACRSVRSATPVTSMISNWAQAMASGVEDSQLDIFAPMLSRVGHLWSQRRPPLPFDLARGLIVLKEGSGIQVAEQRIDNSIYYRSAGVPMDRIEQILLTNS